MISFFYIVFVIQNKGNHHFPSSCDSTVTCDLDPLKTIFAESIDTLLYPIINTVNESLSIPDDFNQAQVNPLLTKSTLPKENLNSYIPISNLSVISKVPEKVVATGRRSHIESNCMSNVLQSAYKQFYSTALKKYTMMSV